MYEFVIFGLAVVFAIAGHLYHEHLYRRLFKSLCDKGILGFVNKPKSAWSDEERKLDPTYGNLTTTSGNMPQIKLLKKYLSVSSLSESDQTLIRTSILAYYCTLPLVLGFIIFVVSGIYAESS